MSKQQTAIEWLEDNLIGNPFSEQDFNHNINVFKQAKQMEKEQIVNAFQHGKINDNKSWAIEYYNETYGK